MKGGEQYETKSELHCSAREAKHSGYQVFMPNAVQHFENGKSNIVTACMRN